jgi:hypothetical protein
MYTQFDIDWASCPRQTMTRDNRPSNVTFVSANDPVQGWKDMVSVVQSAPNAVAMWDTAPCMTQHNISNYVLSTFKGDNGFYFFTDSYSDGRFQTAQDDTACVLERLSHCFDDKASGWRDVPALCHWRDTIKTVMEGLNQAFPMHIRNTDLQVGAGGLGFTRTYDHALHGDGAGSDQKELNVAWSQFGMTTVYIDAKDIVKKGEGFQLLNKEPIVWDTPPGALGLFACNGEAIHGSPVLDFSQPDKTEDSAFFRQRIVLEPIELSP